MAVKHTPTNVVHSGSKGSSTGCGTDTNEQRSHWINSGSKITCNEDVSRNYKIDSTIYIL